MHACMITRRGLHHERGEPTFIHSIYSGCVAAGFGLGQEAAGQARGNEVAVGDGLRFSQYNTWYIRRYACLGSVSTCRSCWIIFVKNRKEAENLWFAGQQISSKYLLFAGIPGTSTVPGAGTSTVPGARYIYEKNFRTPMRIYGVRKSSRCNTYRYSVFGLPTHSIPNQPNQP